MYMDMGSSSCKPLVLSFVGMCLEPWKSFAGAGSIGPVDGFGAPPRTREDLQ